MGRDQEKNLFVAFRASFDAPAGGQAVLRATGSSIFRAWLNGRHVGYGPARGPHGWYRVDEWELSKTMQPGRNEVLIEVAGYNVNSFYLFDQPAFLQAEVVERGGRVLASTAGEGAQPQAAIIKGL